MTSPAIHHAVIDMLDTPRIDKFGTVLNPKTTPENSLQRWRWMLQLQKLFSWLSDFDETQKNEILTSLKDEEVKEELREVLNDPIQMKELQSLISHHAENVKHIIHGYAKLGPVLKIEREMRNIVQKITDLKMKYYIASKSFEQADPRDVRKVLARDSQLTELNIQKEQLLQTKEIVAGYELRKIRNYADQINANKLVQTPSVLEMKTKIRSKIMSGQPVLLSGPVGTGKTKIAQEIYQEILEAKYKSWQIIDVDYTKLKSTRIYNGNEESTKRDLDSRPTQLSNKSDSDQAFIYEEWDITTCLRHGLPLIIDEANRTPANFLSALKKYFALNPWESYRDPVTGEMFVVSAPLQVIFTANEWSKYAKDVSKFQDQIKREVERIYVSYLPDDELYDIFKAKLYQHPGLAQVSTMDLTVTLPALINASHTINDLYLKGAESDVTASSGKKLKLTSAVLDTKRLLQRVNRSLLGGTQNFREVLNMSIVEFIAQGDIDDDRMILCNLFHAQGLLCKENIPALLQWVTSLKPSDLTSILTTSRDNMKIQDGESLSDPRELATTYPISAQGRPAHRLHTFDTLDRDDDGTIIKWLMTSINQLNIFNPLKDSVITTLISKLQNTPDQRWDDDLKTIAQALADRDLSRLSWEELVTYENAIHTLYDQLLPFDERMSSAIIDFNDKITQAQDLLSTQEKKKVEEERKKQEEKKNKKVANHTPNTHRSQIFTLPKTTTSQMYQEMKDNPKTKTYPQYAEWLFTQAGDALWLAFDYPDNRSEIQDGTVDRGDMVDALNTDTNKKILTKLRELIWFDGHIPIWLDSEWKVLYAVVRSDFIRFDRGVIGVSSDCLVPSIGWDPLQWPERIDDLLTDPTLTSKSKAQLIQIQNNSAEMEQNDYDFSRIDVVDGLVTIDGLWLPIEVKRQNLADMRADPKGKTYPQYAESLFEIAGKMLGETFDYPDNRDQINTPDPTNPVKGTVNGDDMVKALSTPNNLKILKKLRELIWFDGHIPIWLDSEWKVIYADVRSGDISFGRFGSGGYYCLVPSNG